MAVYRDLFFRSLSGQLGRSFPVIRKVLPRSEWEGLIRAFMSTHRASTPFFTRLPGEFVEFLESRQGDDGRDPPWLAELARYEWLEVALGMDETDLETVPVDPDCNIVEGTPVVSPLARLEVCSYPVHRIGPEFIPDQPDPAPNHLLVFRRRDDRVGFYRLNPLAAQLFLRLRDRAGPSGLEQVAGLAAEIGRPDDPAVIRGGCEILQTLAARDVLLGARPTT